MYVTSVAFRRVSSVECAWSGSMRDPKHFGHELAEQIVDRLRSRNVTVQQALRRVASEVAGTANTMLLGEGKRRDDVRQMGRRSAIGVRIPHTTRTSEPQDGRLDRGVVSSRPANLKPCCNLCGSRSGAFGCRRAREDDDRRDRCQDQRFREYDHPVRGDRRKPPS